MALIFRRVTSFLISNMAIPVGLYTVVFSTALNKLGCI